MRKSKIIVVLCVAVVGIILTLFVWRKQMELRHAQDIMDDLFPIYHEIEGWMVASSVGGWTYDSQTVTIGTNVYQRASHPEYETKEEILTRMREVYTEEYVKQHFVMDGEGALFIDYEGELYRLLADAVPMTLMRVEKVVEHSEKEMVLQVTYAPSEEIEATVEVYLLKDTEGWRIDELVW